jgi:hypothetical protein
MTRLLPKSIRTNEPNAVLRLRRQRLRPVCYLVALLLCQASWLPHASFSQNKTPDPKKTDGEAAVDPKVAKEVLAMDAKFILALEKRDAEALDKILADEFSDGYKGADRALSKQGAISITKAEGLSIYRIEKDQHLSRSGKNILIEGLARDPHVNVTDVETDIPWVLVQRVWGQRKGHWQLLSQLRPAREEKDVKKD